ncbi:unnamed protein product [Symbiodinium natans]|uniref:EamA domain-containing protein n=1 Tax=Symbiodinium natans TaxID=878477 RepID=A0A812MT01_9DINO|nr:unnamed protein product [Symbiodinium natans]
MDVCFAACAVAQGWTSTAWVVANASLVKREGSAAFTAAVSHILAWAMLLVAATGVNIWTKTGPSDLVDKARRVVWKPAWIAGLGWSSTLFMVVAAGLLGAALGQVLVVSGELSAAVIADLRTQKVQQTAQTSLLHLLGPPSLALTGIIVSLFQEISGVGQASLISFICVAAGAFFCGVCLVLCSVGTTHLREFIGPFNAGAWSAFVASLGNIMIWGAIEIGQYAHVQVDSSTGTFLLWAVVGSASFWNLIVVTFVPPRIGFARTFCLIVTGKVTSGLLVDATGLLSPRRPLTAARCLGSLLVVIAALVQKLGSAKEDSQGHRAYDMVASATTETEVSTEQRLGAAQAQSPVLPSVIGAGAVASSSEYEACEHKEAHRGPGA